MTGNTLGKIQNIKTIFGLIVLIILFATSCSTKKAGFTNKIYHNTTVHYNVWWNGNESLKDGVKALDKSVKDNYTQILPIYKLGTKQDALKIAPQLDRALEKGTKGITKHSINLNGIEHVNYISHCYLLITKSQFYKQEYSTSAFTSQYLISQFKYTKQAYEGMIWYARSMTQQKEYISAETMLDRVIADIENGNAPSSIKKLLYPAYAECALAQEKYKIAVDYLKLSVDNTGDKKFKSRLYYILGQIYQEQEKLNTAFKYYELSTKGNSDYEMLFNARINMALSVTSKGGKNEDVIKLLQKMLADKKNEEYLDQIYYALGEVYLTSGNIDNAVDNWKKSVTNSVSNTPQKIKSGIRLGNIYADPLQDYVNAYSYYDTVVSVLKEEDKNYNQIKNKHSLLNSLAENIQIVNRADSLLAWEAMSPEERNAKIDKIITQLKIEEEKARQAELEEMIKSSVKAQTNTLKGNWYFYTESTVRQGKESFSKLWGFRTLEDNWFMTSRQSIALDFGSNTANEESEEDKSKDTIQQASNVADVNDKHNPAYYLKDIPKTQAEKDTLHNDIAKSSLLLGFIFNEGINNQEKAIESFLRIAEEYQGTPYALPAFYQLYLIYDKQGNTPNANYYRTLILKGFPDSDFANMIRDANYYQEILDRERAAEIEYNKVYQKYLDEEFDEVISLSREAQELYSAPELEPKFLYWEALALLKKGEKDSAIHTLEKILTAYPKSEIIPLVKSQLELFKSKKNLNQLLAASNTPNKEKEDSAGTNQQNTGTVSPTNENKETELSPESELYRYRDNIPHYVVIILNDTKINGTQLSYKVSDFNEIYFSTNGLKTTVLMFSQTLGMLNIERFPDAKKAMEYLTFVQQEDGPLKELKKEDYQVFAVSNQNYMIFYSQKNITAYEKFFNKFYR